MEVEFKIVYDTKDKVYVIHAVDLPGCSTHGYTIEEAMNNIKEAIESYGE